LEKFSVDIDSREENPDRVQHITLDGPDSLVVFRGGLAKLHMGISGFSA